MPRREGVVYVFDTYYALVRQSPPGDPPLFAVVGHHTIGMDRYQWDVRGETAETVDLLSCFEDGLREFRFDGDPADKVQVAWYCGICGRLNAGVFVRDGETRCVSCRELSQWNDIAYATMIDVSYAVRQYTEVAQLSNEGQRTRRQAIESLGAWGVE